jgi:hypothetical protein
MPAKRDRGRYFLAAFPLTLEAPRRRPERARSGILLGHER